MDDGRGGRIHRLTAAAAGIEMGRAEIWFEDGNGQTRSPFDFGFSGFSISRSFVRIFGLIR